METYLIKRKIDVYNKLVAKKKRNVMWTWGLATALTFVIGLSLVMVNIDFPIEGNVFLGIRVSVGVVFVILLVFTIHRLLFYSSTKVLYNFVYPNIIEEIAYNERIELKYDAKVKSKGFYRKGNVLDPRDLSEVVYSKITFTNRQGSLVELYDTSLTDNVRVGGPKSISAMDGYYFIIKQETDGLFQLRTTGRPYNNKLYTQIDKKSPLKVFVKKNETELSAKYYRQFGEIRQKVKAMASFLSVVENEIHIVLNVNRGRRSFKVLDEKGYFELRDNLLTVIEVANIDFSAEV